MVWIGIIHQGGVLHGLQVKSFVFKFIAYSNFPFFMGISVLCVGSVYYIHLVYYPEAPGPYRGLITISALYTAFLELFNT